MTEQLLVGRVVVVAGTQPQLQQVAEAVVAAGARVAVVSPRLQVDGAVVVFRTEPGDASVWDRVAMHVEQHLGPVDGVVTDPPAAPVVTSVFAPDIARRGHGDVVVVTADDDPVGVVTRLCGTRRAAPARSPDGAADR